jgi:hypothetical protein
MRRSSSRFLWFVLVPMAALVVWAWYYAGVLARREAGLAREVAALRGELAQGGFESDAAAINARRARLLLESLKLRDVVQVARRLEADELMQTYAGRPFQLIEFERERAAVALGIRTRAVPAKVRIDESAFEVLSDKSESPAQPRRRWAQLVLAREAALRAVAAGVASYEALPVPAVREMRAGETSPVISEEVLFSVRVTGASARVQAFVEYLALGEKPADLRFAIEHLVLRKDGTAAPDQASATVVLAGLLSPAKPEDAP